MTYSKKLPKLGKIYFRTAKIHFRQKKRPLVDFSKVKRTNFFYECTFQQLLLHRVHVARKKAAEMTFVRKMRAFYVDEIDTCWNGLAFKQSIMIKKVLDTTSTVPFSFSSASTHSSSSSSSSPFGRVTTKAKWQPRIEWPRRRFRWEQSFKQGLSPLPYTHFI